MAIQSVFGHNPSVIGAPFGGSGTSLVDAFQEVHWYDHFVGFTTISETAVGSTYLTTLIGVGGSAVFQDAAGGSLLLTTDAAATDSTVVTSNPEVFSFGVSRRFEMEISFQAGGVASGIYLGLGEGVLIGVDCATIREDSNIGFLLAGNANIQFNYGDTGGANVLTDTGIDLVAATDTVVTASYDGKGGWRAYVDGVQGAAITNTTGSHPDALMTWFLGIENSAVAAAQTLTVNYIYLRWEA